MFTMHLSNRVHTPEEIADLEDFIAGNARFSIDKCYSDLMCQTANAARKLQLQQVME